MYDYSDYAREADAVPCWDDAAAALATFERVLLFGPPGTAKTTFCYQHAHAANPKAESITLDADTTRGNLVEMTIPGGPNGTWVSVSGPMLRAWRAGYPLVVNELDRVGEGSGETVMHAMLDDRAIAAWTLYSGTVVRPADGFACYATMNGTPDMLPSALRDRFDACVYIDRPHPGIIAAIGQPMLRRAADAIFADNPTAWPVSPRQMLRIDGAMRGGMPLDAASRIVIPESVLRDRFVAMVATHADAPAE